MVQVQSTWFPVIDRNPQKFVPNIFHGAGAGTSSRQLSACSIPTQASNIVLPVM